MSVFLISVTCSNGIFPIQMHIPVQPKLTLHYSRSRSSKGRDLYTHCCTLVSHATCQVSLKSVQKFLMGFTIYGHGGHPGHETWIIYRHIGTHISHYENMPIQ